MITAVYDDVAVMNNKSSFKAQRVGKNKVEWKGIRRLSETFPLMLSYRLFQRISMSSVSSQHSGQPYPKRCPRQVKRVVAMRQCIFPPPAVSAPQRLQSRWDGV